MRPPSQKIALPSSHGIKTRETLTKWQKCISLHDTQIELICKSHRRWPSSSRHACWTTMSFLVLLLKVFFALVVASFLPKAYQRMKSVLPLKASKKHLPSIPHDIIVDILSRLPVRSLCRFKCVSKSCCTLISDPDFIKLHLNFNRDNEQKVLAVSTVNTSSSSDQGTAEPLNETSVLFTADEGTMILHLKRSVQTFRISGSCDGLLLLIDKPNSTSSRNSNFFLFNPSTREYNKLPEWPYSNEFEDQDEYSISGFGYNSRRDDYETVRIAYDISDNDYGYCVASLYSLRTNSWRKIPASPPCRRDPSFEDSVGILANGNLHWLLKFSTPFKSFLMVASYCLAGEQFSNVPLPRNVDGIRYAQLGVLKGCLTIIVHQYELFEVWIMKEYGVEETWTKFTINVPNITSIVTLMRLSRNDELLLRIDDSQLVLINPEEDTSRDGEIYGIPILRDAAGYSETLLSPHQQRNEAKIEDIE